MAKSKAQQKWFRKVRGSYLPHAWQGQLIYLSYVGYAVALQVVWFQRGAKLWELLIQVIPAMLVVACLTQFVASKRS